ncbi:unnamed protein product, partial [Scytosiphon promiscuus]
GQHEQEHRQLDGQTEKLPFLLAFTNPMNGSRVEGPDVSLYYKIFSTAGGGGRELTSSEIQRLSRTTTVCFELRGFDNAPEICAPLRVSAVTIKDALPAKWHHVTGRMMDSITDELVGSSHDGIYVFNSLNGYGVLDMCGETACLDSSDLRAAYFDYIYRHPRWNGHPPSSTGIGSKISSTFSIRAGLAGVLSAFNIKSMLDAPCGDLTWMPLVTGIQDVAYTGADIVDIVVESNREKFGPGRAIGDEVVEAAELGEHVAAVMRRGEGLRDPVFVTADLVEGVPASQDGKPFDLVFVRDLMVHLPARHNLKVIQNIQSSGARFLMASTYVEADENEVSESFVPPVGHNINLSLPPYCLPEPIALIRDDSTDRTDRRMGLWDLHQDSPLALSGDCLAMSTTA